MAISATVIWEVRTTGSANNGGGFRAGASGTDYSQQDAAQVAYSDLVIDGVTNTNATSAANPFTSAHVGNIVNITSGTGFTVQRAEIMSVAAGVATFDKSLGTLGSTGGVGYLGGCLVSVTTLAAVMVASNRAWIKSGDYSVTGAITTSAAAVTPSATVPATTICGYHLTRGDLGPHSLLNANRPRLLCNSAMSTLLSVAGAGSIVANLRLVAGSSTPNNCLQVGTNSMVVNCLVSGFSTRGVILGIGSTGMYIEATAGTAAGTAAISVTNSGVLTSCYAHDNQCTGISLGGATNAIGNVSVRNTGANSDGMLVGSGGIITGNLCHANGRDGLRVTSTTPVGMLILNNLLTGNGGWGLNATVAGHAARPEWDGNAYHGNGSGTRTGLSDAGTTNPIYADAPYAYTREATLSGSPYVDATTSDFSLNATAGAGLAARGTGVPSKWPGLTLTAYPDFGPIQHEDSGGGGGGSGSGSYFEG